MIGVEGNLPSVRADVLIAGSATTRTGRALIDGHNIQLGDAIKPGDLVVVNFDKRRVHTGGGLYVLGPDDEGLSLSEDFTICRRMMRVPDGISIGDDRGQFETVPSMDSTCFRVIGTVERVYTPTVYSH